MDMNEVSINCARDASVHWHGKVRITHRPTGITIEGEYNWNDKTGIDAVLVKLAALVDQPQTK